MFFLRNSSGESPAPYLRRVAAAVAYVSLAVYSLGLISLPAAQAKPKAPKSRKAMVRAETVRLRTAPGKHGKMAALLDAGRVARVLEKRDGWAKLKLASGTTGWVRADLLSINKKKTKDSGAFAAQHPVASTSRKTRRAKSSESQVASSRQRSSSKKVVAKKPVMRPMVAKAKPVAKKRVVVAKASNPHLHPSFAPKQVAVAKPQVSLHLASAPMPQPTPNATIEPTTTESYETATLRPGVNEQPLATLPTATAPHVSEVQNIVAVAPAQTEVSEIPVVAKPVQVARATSSVPVTKAAKGKVAPPVKVPIERASKRGDRIVDRALSYRGVPYRMGATGRGAFDCSGFTRYILRQSGENLPRTASEQYHKGTPVNKDQMRPGDLVFFKNTYKRGVSHVGIYMGNGKFVHASSHGGVRTNSLSESYYINHWAGARRPNITQGYD